MTISAGDKMPSGAFGIMTEAGPGAISTDDLFSGKKVVLVSVPGAFTPTCSMNHLPGFVDQFDALFLDELPIRLSFAGQNPHAEPQCAHGDGAADAPQAEEPQRAAADRPRHLSFPAAARPAVVHDDRFGDGKQQRDRLFGDGVVIGGRGDCDRNAARGGRCEIDAIVADTCAGNDA